VRGWGRVGVREETSEGGGGGREVREERR